MKKASVYMYNSLAGILSEDENGYHFQYDASYIKSEGSEPISLTLPLQEKEYDSNVLFPFFDGLIPEGWLLDIAQKNWKLNEVVLIRSQMMAQTLVAIPNRI